MNVRMILERKGHKVITIKPEASIREAMGLLISHKIGSLLVVNDRQEIVGIITERDIFRLTYENDGKIMGIPVHAVMTRNLIVVVPEDSVDYARALISENRIRHLPVIENGKLVGLISIGDVLRAETSQVAVENRYLKDYISGSYPR